MQNLDKKTIFQDTHKWVVWVVCRTL